MRTADTTGVREIAPFYGNHIGLTLGAVLYLSDFVRVILVVVGDSVIFAPVKGVIFASLNGVIFAFVAPFRIFALSQSSRTYTRPCR